MRHRSPPHRRRPFRSLAVECLEPRAVPAGLAQIVELDLDDAINYYDAVAQQGGSLLIAGQRGDPTPIQRLNNQGQPIGTIDLAPVPGYLRFQIDDLSEDGRWALGTSFTTIIDVDTGRVDHRSVTTLWRLSDPSSPIALPPVTGDDNLLDGRSELSNDGTFFTWTKQGRLFLVSPTGFQELSFPPGSPEMRHGYNRFGYFTGFTPDGRTFVGSLRVPPPSQPPSDTGGTIRIVEVTSGSGYPTTGPIYRPTSPDTYQVAVWRDGQPALLQVDPTHISSLASAVSDDGRLIGGAVLPENSGHIAAVWFDGQLRTLRTAAGDAMRGNVGHVVSGIGGDPSRWLAFGTSDHLNYNQPTFNSYGTSYGYGVRDVTFVADQTGVALPLSQWLRENYGLQADLDWFTLTDVLLAGDRLRLFSSKTGFDPPLDCQSCGVPAFLVFTGTQMITIDLQAQPQAQSQSLDVDSDGHITPADALLIINALNSQLAAGIHDGSLPPGPSSATLDVSGDGFLTAADALLIINRLNSTPLAFTRLVRPLPNIHSDLTTPAAEGESSSASDGPDLSILVADLLFQDLATPRRTRAGQSF